MRRTGIEQRKGTADPNPPVSTPQPPVPHPSRFKILRILYHYFKAMKVSTHVTFILESVIASTDRYVQHLVQKSNLSNVKPTTTTGHLIIQPTK
jgi:hypothetical protein